MRGAVDSGLRRNDDTGRVRGGFLAVWTGAAGLRGKKPPHAAHRPACWPTQIDHDHAHDHDHDASTVHVVILSRDRGAGLRGKKPPPAVILRANSVPRPEGSRRLVS
jgi:hypothetical protein